MFLLPFPAIGVLMVNFFNPRKAGFCEYLKRPPLVSGHRCTHNTAENCRNDILVTGVNSIGPSIRYGPAFCPRINTTAGGSSEILVSSGLQKSIRVKVIILSKLNFISDGKPLSYCFSVHKVLYDVFNAHVSFPF